MPRDNAVLPPSNCACQCTILLPPKSEIGFGPGSGNIGTVLIYPFRGLRTLLAFLEYMLPRRMPPGSVTVDAELF